MKSSIVGVLFASSFMLGGCIVVATDDGLDFNHNYHSDHGSVFGAEVLTDAISFRTTSNGCTSKEYFDVDVDQRGDNRFVVAIERQQADRCRADLPEGEVFTWSFDELGIPADADVKIGNTVRRR